MIVISLSLRVCSVVLEACLITSKICTLSITALFGAQKIDLEQIIQKNLIKPNIHQFWKKDTFFEEYILFGR